jgi:hypothetical protein
MKTRGAFTLIEFDGATTDDPLQLEDFHRLQATAPDSN